MKYENDSSTVLFCSLIPFCCIIVKYCYLFRDVKLLDPTSFMTVFSLSGIAESKKQLTNVNEL